MLPSQDIPPQQTRERRAESSREGAVIYTESHAVDGTPEGAVRDGQAVAVVNCLPGLDDAGEQDCGSDVCACEVAQNDREETHAANTAHCPCIRTQ